MLPNTILEVTEENTKHFKCVSIPMFMQIMQMSLRVSHSLHLPYLDLFLIVYSASYLTRFFWSFLLCYIGSQETL